MELFFNLAGTLVAVAMVCQWLRGAPREGVDRRTQVVALALLILILFPVISVTDDLLASQNPAETDSCQRLDHLVARALPAPSAAAWLVEPSLEELPAGLLRMAATGDFEMPVAQVPALAPISNRPPPRG